MTESTGQPPSASEGTPPGASRRRNVIARHWRGETPFWTALILVTLIAGLLFYTGAVFVLRGIVPLETPGSRMVQLTLIMALICSFAIWQMVGTWRAASRANAPGRWGLTRWLARGLAVAMGGAGLLFLKAYPGTMGTLLEQANDQDDIGKGGYSVAVEDTNLLISGNFAWGMLDAVTHELSANPGIESVVLNSPGGHVGVGSRIYALIRGRKLNTLAVEKCMSACLLAFLAGENRYLQRDAKLGFHSASGTADTAIAAGMGEIVAIYRAAGVAEPFIEEMQNVPPESVWIPKAKELVEANIVTGVVD